MAIERYEVMQKAHARLRTRLTGKDGGSIEYDLVESPDDVLSKRARAETDSGLDGHQASHDRWTAPERGS